MVDWAMGRNVVDSQTELLENDPEDQKAAEFLAALKVAFGSRSFLASEVADRAEMSGSVGEDKRLPEIMDVVSRYRSPTVIGTYLRDIADQNIGGLALRRVGADGHRKVNRWRVEPVAPTN